MSYDSAGPDFCRLIFVGMGSLMTMTSRRLMLVHAHPDDEVTSTGLTMALHASRGDAVTLVTCTLGEEGEVVDPDLVHLAADREDSLAEHRITELEASMEALGITDAVRLGGDHCYRDSGMGTDENGNAVARDELHPGCFWLADLLEAANHMVALIRDRRPEVLITYDENGHYGHPDHIKAHRVAMYGAMLAAVPSHRRDLGEAWQVPRILWTALGESAMRAGLRRLQEIGDAATFGGMDPDGPLPPMVVPDDDISVTVHAPELMHRKIAAFRAHASQIQPDSGFVQMFEHESAHGMAGEAFRLAGGVPFPEGATDVFAGLD